MSEPTEQTYRIDFGGIVFHNKAAAQPTCWLGNYGEARVSATAKDSLLAKIETLKDFAPQGRTEREDAFVTTIGRTLVTDEITGEVGVIPGAKIDGMNLAEVIALQGSMLSFLQARIEGH